MRKGGMIQQLRSQFRGDFAIIHALPFLAGVRTSHYSEDRPEGATAVKIMSKPREGLHVFSSSWKNWGTSNKIHLSARCGAGFGCGIIAA